MGSCVFHKKPELYQAIVWNLFQSTKCDANVENLSLSDVVANPNLKPEFAETLELAFGMNAFKQLRSSLNLYRTNIVDKVLVVVDDEFREAKNIGEIETYGLETDMEWKTNRFSLGANYSYANSFVNTPVTTFNGESNAEYRTASYPAHQWKGKVFFDFSEIYLQSGVLAKWESAVKCAFNNCFQQEGAALDYVLDPNAFYENRYELKSVVQVDWVLSSHEILVAGMKSQMHFKIKNLLDSKFDYPGDKGGSSSFDIPGLGRSMELSFQQKF